jgi:hypothetical protein
MVRNCIEDGKIKTGSLMKPNRFSKFFWSASGWLAVIFMVVGFAMVFALAISPLWGWHWFFGWCNVAVLAAIFFDSSTGYRAALKKPWEKGRRLFAYYLISLILISLSVNIFVSMKGNSW